MRAFLVNSISAALLVFVQAGNALAAPAETVLWSFTGPTEDGANPTGALIADTSGNLYGTSTYGGTLNYGTVFRLAPPASGQTAWTETVLYNFGSYAHDAAIPMGALIFDSAGNLYGTSYKGGTRNHGTVFRLTPPVSGSGAWTETVLYSFGSHTGDGINPEAALVADSAGNLYGTTYRGGAKNYGAAFELTPPVSGNTNWTETVLWNFGVQTGDGRYPTSTLIQNASGALYGTTQLGGPFNVGTVFQLAPPANLGSAWTETVLHGFTGYSASTPDGRDPLGGLVADATGVLYGTTQQGGTIKNSRSNAGTVYQLTPPPAQTGGPWTEVILYSFGAGNDGITPRAGLLAGPAGSFYGTTRAGGGSNAGTVFQMTPPTTTTGTWTETVLYGFQDTFAPGSPDGGYPLAGVFADQKGALYGTTQQGGPGNFGTVFKLTQ